MQDCLGNKEEAGGRGEGGQPIPQLNVDNNFSGRLSHARRGGQSTNDPSATLINSVLLNVPSDVNESFLPDKVYSLEILYLTFGNLYFRFST